MLLGVGNKNIVPWTLLFHISPVVLVFMYDTMGGGIGALIYEHCCIHIAPVVLVFMYVTGGGGNWDVVL